MNCADSRWPVFQWGLSGLLMVAVGCSLSGPDPGPPGAVVVSAVVTGSDPDNSYQLVVRSQDGSVSVAAILRKTEPVKFVNLRPDDYQARLGDVADNCTADAVLKFFTVAPADTSSVTFNITCEPEVPDGPALPLARPPGAR